MQCLLALNDKPSTSNPNLTQIISHITTARSLRSQPHSHSRRLAAPPPRILSSVISFLSQQ
ncbi:hypothetical protein Ancab_001260, partial [Ancistrocladus abbreviatus]